MTILKNVGDIAEAPECSILGSLRIWNKNVNELTNQTLLTSHKKLLRIHDRNKVDTAFKYMVAEIQKESLLGNIEELTIESFKIPQKPILIGEVMAMVQDFSLIERQAIFFALSEGMHLRDALSLRREDLKETYSGLSYQILKFIPRHIRCRYVFWNYSEQGIATMLYGFEGKFMDKTKLTWRNFERVCSNVTIHSDPDSDLLTALLI